MSVDESKFDINVFNLILKDIIYGNITPSIAQMRNDPRYLGMLKDQKETNPLIGKLIQALKSKPKITCLAPTAPKCNQKPIKSHSAQKSGPLLLLADKNQHVISFRTEVQFEKPPQTKAKLIGINEAGLFVGLCGKHDNEIFSEIERNPIISPTEEQHFLLSYRSLLREYYAKRCQAEASRTMAKSLGNDNSLSEYARTLMILLAYGPTVGESHFRIIKESYDYFYKNKFFSILKHKESLIYISKIINGILPYSVVSFFNPFFDFAGNKIKNDGPQKLLPFMTLNVIPGSKRSLITIAYINKFKNHLSSIISEIELADESTFLKLIWELAMRNSENIFVSPTSWNKLKENDKSQLERFIGDAVGLRWKTFPRIELPPV